jgi:UDP-N-acetylmuramate--alanine ligase
MNLKEIKTAYFIGIGGIGMSALARYFNTLGIAVHGYDKTRTDFTDQLSAEGMDIRYYEDISRIPEEVVDSQKTAIVIYTPAIPSANTELIYLRAKGLKLYKRAEVLGYISKNSFTIAVAGTHGKTTTCSMVAHLLNECGVNFNAFLGGISTNFNTNYISKTNGIQLFDEPIMVVEADEFDRSFLQLSPNISIVTSTDADHLDIYGAASEVKKSFQAFVNCLQLSGTAIIREKLDLTFLGELIRYGKARKSDARYDHVNIHEQQFQFSYSFKKINIDLVNGIPGFYNVENATAAITACLKLGINIGELASALQNFKGVKRRFEYIVRTENHVVIDDYAHHPAELTACITSIKELYPDKRITGVFQPHLFSRTRDFADNFAKALELLDECWLLDIYPARELPIEGINSEFLALKMTTNVKLVSKPGVLKTLEYDKPEVLVILGAGDIDTLIKPIRELYA